ncbi:hypothetical protein AC578_2409 [Pseudocercospora eumusae]|uniref:Uncharacterized protein n=1 Tax=Pseudocercospora eumusae TaxID=321146 RepID=A0A139HX81_9PEZI|nr:hypothetical protein AC578_2409 [Pseudocercospora eumusae]
MAAPPAEFMDFAAGICQSLACRALRVVPNAIIAMFDNSIVRQNEVAKHYEVEYAVRPTEALREAYYRETFLKLREALVQRRAMPVAASG